MEFIYKNWCHRVPGGDDNRNSYIRLQPVGESKKSRSKTGSHVGIDQLSWIINRKRTSCYESYSQILYISKYSIWLCMQYFFKFKKFKYFHQTDLDTSASPTEPHPYFQLSGIKVRLRTCEAPGLQSWW